MPINLAISSSVSALKIGEAADITFTFSEPPVGFSMADISVSGGTLSGLTNLGAGVYAAAFTPAVGVNAGAGNITVAAGSYANAQGDAGAAASLPPIFIDTRRPTVEIALADTALGIGEATDVTFTFSEAVTGFTLADIAPMNATLSSLTTSDNITYTATLTPSAGVTDTSNLISVDLTGVQDGAGNSGSGSASSPNYVLDAHRPTATIVMGDADLKAGESSLVTFTFSEAVAGFDNADLSIPSGALSSVSSSDGGITWTATLIPDANVHDTSNVIVMNNAGYTDLAGNAGAGVTNSANFSVRTVRPDATIVVSDAAFLVGETADVTITFTEAVSGFDNADLTVANGQLSSFSSSDGGVTWTATLTPAAGVTDTSNLISLDRSGVMNVAGNAGVGSVNSNNYAIDTARPTATITVANPALQSGQTSLVTIAFSEAVTGFDLSDLVAANGALSNLTSADGGKTWMATLTPSAGVADPTNLIVLDTALASDLAGNPGAGLTMSNNYQVGYVPPPPVSQDDLVELPAGGGSVSAGPGRDSVAGAGGDDLIQGNAGDDSLSGGGGDDVVRGGQDSDFVHGNSGADMLFGDLGNDSLFGGQGDDFVQGGAGGDYVLGDLGRDTLLGGRGADTVSGGAGDDYLSGDLGDDVLVGGAGADLFSFEGGEGRDVVMDFSPGEGDRIRISSADAADYAAVSALLIADGGNTIIDLGGQTIVLVGVARSALTAADFIFG